MESFLKFVIAVLVMQQVTALRYSIRPRTPRICPLNEVYNSCGSACPTTCQNYLDKTPRFCTMQCVVGCFCAEGYIRNSVDNKCCLLAQCPATTTATTTTTQSPVGSCPLNQEYAECGTACPLTCENYLNPPQFCTDNCVTGCKCLDGYVKKSDGSCCKTSDC